MYTQLHETIAFNQHGYIVILAISDKVLCVCAVSGITNPISIYTELLINVYLHPINNIRVYPNLIYKSTKPAPMNEEYTSMDANPR